MSEAPSIRLSELRPGSFFLHYQLLEQIGTGGQGVVWSCLDPQHDRIVAIKLSEIPYTDQLQIDDMVFERQIDKLVSLRHPHVLPMYDLGLSGQVRYQVSSFIPGGSLADKLRKGPAPTQLALQYAAQIGAALDYLHAQGVIHRDLKPGNVLLDFSQNVYVSDFGLARVVSTTTDAMHTGRGTPPYSPPEQHKLAKMTRQSDIFSFGVLLYEIFTGLLPWKGERSLGMQQLYSKDELPDPYDANPALPRLLVKVLRQMTAAEPAVRPRSASEAMSMLYYVFSLPSVPVEPAGDKDEAALRDFDAQELLKQSLSSWDPSAGTMNLSLTRYALIELAQKKPGREASSPEVQCFMLQNALTFGYHDDFWWQQVTTPQDRLNTAAALLGKGNEVITTRIVNHLVNDPELHESTPPLPAAMVTSLLEMASKASDPLLREQSLKALRLLLPSAREWRKTALSPEQDRTLADLALADTAEGDNAAQLIGHVRSLQAAQTVLDQADDDRRVAALYAIQRSAGSLPISTPFQVRVGITFEWILQRLFARPLTLLGGYGMSLLGMTLGFGLYAYLSYRLPDFFDTLRITSSLERGVIMGAMFGLGLFLARLIAERLSTAIAPLRMTLAAILGGLVMNLGVFTFDVLILNRVPNGVLITAGCLLTALGFALGALNRSRAWKIGISLVAFFGAVAGTWFASSALRMSPIFTYESTWPPAKLLGVISLTVLPAVILGNLVDLSYKEE